MNKTEIQLNVIKVVVPLLTEVIQWSNYHQKEISVQSAIDKVCMILEKNSEMVIPKELHMEMKKLWVNLLNVVSTKEPIFMVFTQILKNHIKSTMIEVRHKNFTKGPIIYFIECSYPISHETEVLHLVGALMEHFLEGSVPLRLW